VVTAGADLSLPHVCTGDPLRCRPATADGTVALAAASQIMDGVSFAWSVSPPADRPLGDGRRVAFVPSPDVASPVVLVETDGTAISGDWVFTVEARDAAGVVGRASTRVSVANEPPVFEETIPPIHHHYDAVARVFTAAGRIPVSISDPDGDPVEVLAPVWRHAGDGGSPFGGQFLADESAVTYHLSVAYEEPSDASSLIGGEGLVREIEFAVRDANGAETRETWPILVANRAPVESSPRVAIAIVGHSFDWTALEYRASAPLSTWTDPDGDPLFPGEAPTNHPICAELDVVGGATTVRCRMAYADAPAVGQFATVHSLTSSVRDPWASTTSGEVRLTIQNAKPMLVTTSPDLGVAACVSDDSRCCLKDPDHPLECIIPSQTMAASSRYLSDIAIDPDGDPVKVTFPSGPVTATPMVGVCPGCTFAVHAPAVTASCDLREQPTASVSIDDGSGPQAVTIEPRRDCP
jgi:hypothetical protein